jgi:hypothetical protein
LGGGDEGALPLWLNDMLIWENGPDSWGYE